MAILRDEKIYQTAYAVSEYTNDVYNVVFKFIKTDITGNGYVSECYYKHTGYGTHLNLFYLSELKGFCDYITSEQQLIKLINKLNEN